jgi:hypothetical protein
LLDGRLPAFKDACVTGAKLKSEDIPWPEAEGIAKRLVKQLSKLFQKPLAFKPAETLRTYPAPDDFPENILWNQTRKWSWIDSTRPGLVLIARRQVVHAQISANSLDCQHNGCTRGVVAKLELTTTPLKRD